MQVMKHFRCNFKKVAKTTIAAVLGWQVRRLRRRHSFKVIAVAGSVGKTSTKFAIATVLSKKLRVRFQEGNYNDYISVPLIFFGLSMPSLFNPIAWLAVFIKAEKQIWRSYPYDVVVAEVGTDGPGQIAAFKRYLEADLGVLTAISPEHMEFFESLDDVAKEELAIANFSKKLLINADFVDEKYRTTTRKPLLTYGLKQKTDYQLYDLRFDGREYSFGIRYQDESLFVDKHASIAETQLYSICAAAAVAWESGCTKEEILAGIHSIKPVSGRMQHLKGVNGSLILDDTYNASPQATKAALDTLYKLHATQKIALLGNMNELGNYSKEMHLEIGEYCDPKQLDLVVTVGKDANDYLAAAAEKRGCNVKSFINPYAAGQFIRENVRTGNAIILAKGSQNGVFAEEAIKQFLADSKDVKNLVRQSKQWLAIKHKQFARKT